MSRGGRVVVGDANARPIPQHRCRRGRRADQTGAVVAGASVIAVNSATGATRDVISGADGSATITGLSLTGTYAIRVNKTGFSDEVITDLALRAGETATVKVSRVAIAATPRCSPTVRSLMAR
jgi:hypothetical protein